MLGIEVRDVSQRFPARGRRSAPVDALARVDLAVPPGEFCCLVGPSGCGKTTLLRLVAGLESPTAGTVTVDGRSPAAARAAKEVALVPQTPALLPWRDVWRNVRLLTEVNRSASGHRALGDDEVRELLASVGLDGFLHALPHELSGGMQQRVALVRAFALGAPMLLLDEPFAALDELTRSSMQFLLLDLWQRHRSTALFVTHSVHEAVLLADRVVVMTPRPGRVLAEVTVDLPRPRPVGVEDDPAYLALVAHVRRALREGSAA